MIEQILITEWVAKEIKKLSKVKACNLLNQIVAIDEGGFVWYTNGRIIYKITRLETADIAAGIYSIKTITKGKAKGTFIVLLEEAPDNKFPDITLIWDAYIRKGLKKGFKLLKTEAQYDLASRILTLYKLADKFCASDYLLPNVELEVLPNYTSEEPRDRLMFTWGATVSFIMCRFILCV